MKTGNFRIITSRSAYFQKRSVVPRSLFFQDKIKYIRYLIWGLIAAFIIPGCSILKNTFAPYRLSDEVEVVENLVYKPLSSNPKHRLDLFIPKKGDSPFPVAIFIHGGFWKNQDKRYFRPITGLYWNFGFALAQQGFVVAVISYRIYPESQIDDQIEDVGSAVTWVREQIEQYNGDARRIHLIGHSAGGHLAAMVGADRQSGVASIVALSPILDVVHMKENQADDFNRETVFPVFGSDEEDWRRRSPVEIWNPQATPIKIIVGSQDYGFVLEQARQFEVKARTLNWKVELEIIEGYEHSDLVLSVTDKISPIITKSLNFMEQYNK